MSRLPATPAPDFRSADVLRQHIADTMASANPLAGPSVVMTASPVQRRVRSIPLQIAVAPGRRARAKISIWPRPMRSVRSARRTSASKPSE